MEKATKVMTLQKAKELSMKYNLNIKVEVKKAIVTMKILRRASMRIKMRRIADIKK